MVFSDGLHVGSSISCNVFQGTPAARASRFLLHPRSRRAARIRLRISSMSVIEDIFSQISVIRQAALSRNSVMAEICDAVDTAEMDDTDGKQMHAARWAAFDAVLQSLIEDGAVTSLNDWCKRAGVSWSTVGEFKAGRTVELTDRTLRKMAAAVGVSVARLRGDQEAAILEDLAALPPDERDDILTLIRQRARRSRAHEQLGGE